MISLAKYSDGRGRQTSGACRVERDNHGDAEAFKSGVQNAESLKGLTSHPSLNLVVQSWKPQSQ
jgi:hypothetical protein